MAASITLNNNYLTIHNTGMVSAVGNNRTLTAKISNISDNYITLSTVDSVAGWAVNDYVMFTPITGTTAIEIKQIASISNNLYSFSLYSPLTSYTLSNLSAIPVNVPHAINITRSVSVKGFNKETRGTIKILDTCTLDLQYINLTNLGIIADQYKSGIVLINSKDSNVNITNCSYIGEDNTNLQSIKPYITNQTIALSTLTGNRLVLNNNQICNLSSYSIYLDKFAFKHLVLSNNTFLRAPVYIQTQRTSAEDINYNISFQDNNFIGNTNININAALYVNCKDLIFPGNINNDICNNNTFYNNQHAGLYVANLYNSILLSLDFSHKVL